jgi:UrcA family protein
MKLILASALAVAAVAGAASAETRILYGDLNLSTAAGVAAFDARIANAAQSMCKDATRPVSRLSDSAHCAAAVRAEAVSQLPAQARAQYAANRRSPCKPGEEQWRPKGPTERSAGPFSVRDLRRRHIAAITVTRARNTDSPHRTCRRQERRTLRRHAMKTEFATASILALTSFAAALLGTGAPAFAAEKEARIPFSDLNLSTGRGADLLDVRIEQATRDLCRGARRPGSRINDRAYCQAAVRNEVMRQLPAASQRDYALARLPRIDL